ncbi:membrane protein [Streptococcus pneumoniae]|nr:membrane protein [Streptococcus pneumoniae]
MSKHYKLVFYSRIFLFLAAFTGVYLEITRHGGFGMLLYYTVLSNLLVTIFTLYLLKVMSRVGENWQRPSLLRLKGGVTMSIMITCVIYHFLLAPIATNFYTLENFLCHYIVPIWFLADTLFFDKQGQYKIWDPAVWTILPFLYMMFALFNGLVLKLNIPNAKDNPFPYFFLNVNKGWNVVFKWCLIIFVAYMVAGFIFYFIKQIKRKSSFILFENLFKPFILFENLFNPHLQPQNSVLSNLNLKKCFELASSVCRICRILTTSVPSTTLKTCFELTTSVLSATSKQCFEQPEASF